MERLFVYLKWGVMMSFKMKSKRQWDIFWVNLNDIKEENIIKKSRPCVIIQNDTANIFSNTTIVAPITSKNKPSIPTHCKLDDRPMINGIILCEQITTINKSQIGKYICTLTKEEIENVKYCLKLSMGI